MRDIKAVIAAVLDKMPEEWVAPHIGKTSKLVFVSQIDDILGKPLAPEAEYQRWEWFTDAIARHVGIYKKWEREISEIILDDK